MILTLAIAVSTLGAFAGEDEVNPKVLNAFKTEFNTANDVEWSEGTDFFKAAFVYNDRHLFAYYTKTGELLALARYISPLDLPLSLQKNLKEGYGEYWISDLMEVAKGDGTTYYVTLEDADTRVMLKTTDTFGWNFYKKTRKA